MSAGVLTPENAPAVHATQKLRDLIEDVQYGLFPAAELQDALTELEVMLGLPLTEPIA